MDARSSRWRGRPSLVWRGRTLVELDGSAHARLRRQVHRAFTPRTVEHLRPAVEAIIQELLDTMAALGGGDLMEQLAFPLPVRVIGRLFGVPSADLPPFRDQILALTTVFEAGASLEMRDAADAAMLDCTNYFTRLIADKRARPSDDLLSRLATGEESASPDDRLDDEELNTLALFLFMAGFDDDEPRRKRCPRAARPSRPAPPVARTSGRVHGPGRRAPALLRHAAGAHPLHHRAHRLR